MNAHRAVQCWVNTSVSQASGSALQLLNWLSWAENLVAKRSTSKGPQYWLIALKNSPLSIQSVLSLRRLDKKSAGRFSFPGRCWADTLICLCKHHANICFVNAISLGDFVPPDLLMYDTMAILSDLINTSIYLPSSKRT